MRILGLNSIGYLVPLWLNVLSKPTLLNDANFIAIMRLDKVCYHNAIFLLLDRDWYVEEMNSSSSLILGIDRKTLKSSKLNISELCPEIIISTPILKKQKIITKVYKPTIKSPVINLENESGSIIANTPILEKSEDFFEAKCNIIPVITSSEELLGYELMISIKENESTIPKRNFTPPDFGFKFNGSTGYYEIKSIEEDTNSESCLFNSLNRIRMNTNAMGEFYSEKNHFNNSDESLSIKGTFKNICDEFESYHTLFHQTIL